MTKWAYGNEDKLARRQTILAAAARLFEESGALPTAKEIAEAAGLAKGTVYLYFETKEEIFATLLLNGWTSVADEIDAAWSKAAGSRQDKIDVFLRAWIGALSERRKLLELDALGYGMLDRNLDREISERLKHTFLQRLGQSGALIDSAFSLVSPRGLQILMRSYALMRGLWQSGVGIRSADMSDHCTWSGADPGLFDQELYDALVEYWGGALSRPAHFASEAQNR
ncbi:TetR/AcrR family transcriptional regulator [Sphingobium subterraneum]|uniref:AcrR family transcriptional regulator n=1 Tax=Sphingobium subterraneum TaxID=627688 RepID=A0A841JAZ7_9SPHN|nr:TetR/AcrR family transcriptional regulator [Sphingobium subterraneum]MBB6125301.1 AcrR family transcriptional regulator [Sphingobium subterraneum]